MKTINHLKLEGREMNSSKQSIKTKILELLYRNSYKKARFPESQVF